MAIDSGGKDIIFWECKYWANKVGVDVFYALEQKASQADWKRGTRKEHFILFAVNGFCAVLEELSKVRKALVLVS